MNNVNKISPKGGDNIEVTASFEISFIFDLKKVAGGLVNDNGTNEVN